MTCDINCDLGEGIGNDALIIPYVSSANIACGYHAGDDNTMRHTILLAKNAGVAIGAHPSFLDRENFGRMEHPSLSPQQVYDLVTAQLHIFHKVVVQCDAHLQHVKPHGALYNMAARNRDLAKAVVEAVYDFDNSLIIFGLSGSHLISEAKLKHIKTASEVFADRTYQDDSSLTPRTLNNALINEEEQSLQQVLRMIKKGLVISTSGKEICIVAETICLHGDGKKAIDFARAIHEKLLRENIIVKAPAKYHT